MKKSLVSIVVLAGAALGGAALGGVFAAQRHAAAPRGASLAVATGPAPAASAVFEVAPVAASAADDFRRIAWNELAPQDWDPAKKARGTDVADALADAGPRAVSPRKEARDEMRELQDHAPANPEMDGQRVRIAGYLVPLEETADGMKEFLLVPRAGAGIRTPPPPANQIIDVRPDVPPKDLHAMDAVSITGVLRTERSETAAGASSYRMDAVAIERYRPGHAPG